MNRRLRVPFPTSSNFTEWQTAVTDALNQLPPLIMFNGNPNTSGVTADPATLGFNVGSGETNRLWVNLSGVTNTWSLLSYI